MTVAMITVIVVAMMVGNSNAMEKGKFTVVIAMLVAIITPMTMAALVVMVSNSPWQRAMEMTVMTTMMMMMMMMLMMMMVTVPCYE